MGISIQLFNFCEWDELHKGKKITTNCNWNKSIEECLKMDGSILSSYCNLYINWNVEQKILVDEFHLGIPLK